ncbi:carboxypeptidase-like regulatory domain-containing protein [Patescibacteria group bacterium]
MAQKPADKKTAEDPAEQNYRKKEPHMILRFALIDTVVAAVLLLLITGVLFMVRNWQINVEETNSFSIVQSNHVTAQVPIYIDPRDRHSPPVAPLPPAIIMAVNVERVNGIAINQSADPIQVEVGDLVQYRVDYKPWRINLIAPFDMVQSYDPGFLQYVGMYQDINGADQPVTQGLIHWTDVSNGEDVYSTETRTVKPEYRVIRAGIRPNTNLSTELSFEFESETIYGTSIFDKLKVDNPPPLPVITASRSSLNTAATIDENELVRARISIANTGEIAIAAPVKVTVTYNANYLNYIGTETTTGALSVSSDNVAAAQVTSGGALVWSDATNGHSIAPGTSAFLGVRFKAVKPGTRPNTNINIAVAAKDTRDRSATAAFTIAGLVVNALPIPEPEPEPEPVIRQALQTIQDFFTLTPEHETVVSTVIAPSTAIINAINLAAAANPLNIGYLFLLLFTEPLQLILRRRRGSFSVVYNALTKHPLSLVMVRLVEAESGRIMKTAVSDPKGRFSLSGPPGKYRIQITKSGFIFPTKTIKGIRDAGFTNIYHGDIFELTADKPAVTASVPIDPPKADLTHKAVWRSNLYNSIRNIIAWAGIVVAMVLALIAPSALTIGLLVAHVAFFFLFRYFARLEAPPTWGMVYNFITGKPVRGALVRIYDAQYERLLDSKVTNRRGRYGFLVGQNEYLLDAAKVGYQFPAPEKKKSHDYLGGKFTPHDSVKLDIPIKRQARQKK